jgi:hypothetical protein
MYTTFIKGSGNVSLTPYFIGLPTGEIYSQIIAFPAKSVDSSGIFTKNTNYSYIGFQTGKYPFVLNPADPFDGTLLSREINLANNFTGFYCKLTHTGDGMYLMVN